MYILYLVVNIVAAGYARTSTSDQNIGSQIEALLAAGVSSDMIFQDAGISGTKAPEARAGYKRLMRTIEIGGITDLYLFELSRLGRDTMSTIGELIRLDKAGVRVHSLSERERIINESRPEFRPILISALQLAAEIERVHISERTRQGLLTARTRGVRLGPPMKEPNWKEVRRFMDLGLSERAAALATGCRLSTYYDWKRKRNKKYPFEEEPNQ